MGWTGRPPAQRHAESVGGFEKEARGGHAMPAKQTLQSVRAFGSGARSARTAVAGRHCASERRLDRAATNRSIWLEGNATISRSRSGFCLWRGLHSACCSYGHSRPTHLSPFAMAERLRGEAHRIHPAGLSRPCHCFWRGRHLLASYQRYNNEARTHLSLGKDAPASREVQAVGRILPVPILGGLHHQYVRI